MKRYLLLFILILLLCGCDKKYTTITLDINPSVEIKIDKDEKVVDINPLNDDAKSVVDFEYEKLSLEKCIYEIGSRVLDNNYIHNSEAVVLVHTDNNKYNDHIEKYVKDYFSERNIIVNTVFIDKITKNDKVLAKKYNISEAKAAYINSVAKDHDISVEELVDRTLNEIHETSDTGNVCKDGYTLNRGVCKKELAKEDALEGNVCPNDYFEYKGKCYRDEPNTDEYELLCHDDFVMENNKCVRYVKMNATPKTYMCSTGTLYKKSDIGLSVVGSGDDTYVCADFSKAKEPVLRCLNNKGHIMINGKCYNGPAPLINGGCPNGDTIRNGACYSLDTYDQYECPNGNIYEKSKGILPKYCPDTIKTTKPKITEYSCPEDYVVDGTTCKKKEEQDPDQNWLCPTGFTKVESGRCLNLSDTKSKINGYYCKDDRYELWDKVCTLYDVIDPEKK